MKLRTLFEDVENQEYESVDAHMETLRNKIKVNEKRRRQLNLTITDLQQEYTKKGGVLSSGTIMNNDAGREFQNVRAPYLRQRSKLDDTEIRLKQELKKIQPTTFLAICNYTTNMYFKKFNLDPISNEPVGVRWTDLKHQARRYSGSDADKKQMDRVTVLCKKFVPDCVCKVITISLQD